MGVYIKGAKMPKQCSDCYFEERDTCRLLKKNVVGWGIMAGCPLIPVPDHGDLIDRDIVSDALDVMTAYHTLGDAYDWVTYTAPVVIPAERSEDDA